MNAKRFALASLLSAAVLALFADPVAAQSTSADLINELNNKLLYIALPITLLVEVILIYAVIRFKDNDEPKPTKENRRLEITWTVATAFILLFVGVASYGVMADPNVTFNEADQGIAPDDGDVLVEAEAYQWGWNMSYPEHGISMEGVGEGPTIYLPEGQDVYIGVGSRDVIHAFHVPDLGLKMDAIQKRPSTSKPATCRKAPTKATARSTVASRTRTCTSPLRSSTRPSTTSGSPSRPNPATRLATKPTNRPETTTPRRCGFRLFYC